ncbi:MAG: GNAT family N-acetyltransferase [Rhodothermales bacterium]
MIPDLAIEALDLATAGERLRALRVLLRDAIDDGASVGFLATATDEQIDAYWRQALEEVAVGRRVVFAALRGAQVVGSVQLVFAAQQNAPHRAEVQRLLVLRSQRRAGIGRCLMAALERAALDRGYSLLVLNTRAGDPPEALYRSIGYEPIGRVPGFALNPDGTPNDTMLLYKRLSGA